METVSCPLLGGEDSWIWTATGSDPLCEQRLLAVRSGREPQDRPALLEVASDPL